MEYSLNIYKIAKFTVLQFTYEDGFSRDIIGQNAMQICKDGK